jgi:hypothetical protein
MARLGRVHLVNSETVFDLDARKIDKARDFP